MLTISIPQLEGHVHRRGQRMLLCNECGEVLLPEAAALHASGVVLHWSCPAREEPLPPAD